MERKLNILCISGYFKGEDFIRACHQEGYRVYLMTSKKLESKPWPRECLEEIFYVVENEQKSWNMGDVVKGLAYKFRTIAFDKFISLDDYDVEQTATLREIFRMPGMGQTTARYFRDKLAMRMKAEEHGILNPAFSSTFHDEKISRFLENTSPPWLIKPRGGAAAIGIKKVHTRDEVWAALNTMGDNRHSYLIEKFNPGDVFHVDTLTYDGKVLFTRVSRYLDPPFVVAHSGGIFRTHTLKSGSEDEVALKKINKHLLTSFGMRYSASHSEYIRSSETGEYLFLETSSRVGGAHIAEMVEAASGINLWNEWAKIESSVVLKTKYKLPEVHEDYAGIVVSLSRFQHPDDSSFNDPEICWRLKKDWHIGLIVRSDNQEKVLNLLQKYTDRIRDEFHASLPPKEMPSG